MVTEHFDRVKDVATGLGESRGIWTASAAKTLAAYIQAHADAALLALKQLKPYPQSGNSTTRLKLILGRPHRKSR